MKVVTEGTGECREMDGSGTVPKTKTQRHRFALPCGQLRQSGIQRHLTAEQTICRALNRWLCAGRYIFKFKLQKTHVTDGAAKALRMPAAIRSGAFGKNGNFTSFDRFGAVLAKPNLLHFQNDELLASGHVFDRRNGRLVVVD